MLRATKMAGRGCRPRLLLASTRLLLASARLLLASAMCLLAALGGTTETRAASSAAGENPGPEALVLEVSDRLLAEVKANAAALKSDPSLAIELAEEVVGPHIDLEAASRQILRAHWQRATPAQRERFVDEFRTMLLRTYATAIPEYADETFSYRSVRTSEREGHAIVRTQLDTRGGGPPVRVDYRLHRVDGAWKVHDVLVEGVSLVVTHRANFSEELKRADLDTLIERMAEKNRRRGGG